MKKLKQSYKEEIGRQLARVERGKRKVKEVEGELIKAGSGFSAPRLGRLKYRKVAAPKRMVVQLRSAKDEINDEVKTERSWVRSDVSYF